MENRKLLKILVISLFGSGFFISSSQSVSAYGYGVHAALTQSAVNFYNQSYPDNKISSDLKAYLVDGSRREDDTPRWMNHFYDPIHNRGLSYDPAIRPDIPIPGSWDSSKEWATSEGDQNGGRYKTGETIGTILTALQSGQLSDISSQSDFTWQKAIQLYASGKKEEAMFALGHVLHLMEDMTVPAHVRNDPHPDSDSYELYTDQFSYDHPDKNLLNRLINKTPVSVANLGAYFDSLATYTNTHFYSQHTIGIQSGYDLPQPLYSEKSGDYFYGIGDAEGFGKYKLFIKTSSAALIINKNDISLYLDKNNGDAVLGDYWNILSTKSVQYGAGVINLFFQEAEAAEKNNTTPREPAAGKSFIASALDAFLKFSQVAKTAARSALAEIFGGGGVNNLSGTIDLNNQGEPTINTKAGAGASATQPIAPPPRLSITEVMYNPPGSDAGREWIEVLNTGDSSVDLSDLKFQTGGTAHGLANKNNGLKLRSGGFGIIANNAELFKSDNPNYRSPIWEASFSLNNSGETLSLSANGVSISDLGYNSGWGANGDGDSLQLINSRWLASSPTPGEMNKIPEKISPKPVGSSVGAASSTEGNPKINKANQIPDQATSSVPESKTVISPKTNPSCSFETNQSPSRASVIINEVAWMGDTKSANNEWLELRNISNGVIDLAGWRILDSGGKISIPLEGKIPASGYFLLERTDDNSVPAVKADLIYTGSLANNGGNLRVFNNNCGLADEVLDASGWLAGDNSAKRTMERDDAGFGWHTSTAVGGTPRISNDRAFIAPVTTGGGGGGAAAIHNQNSNDGLSAANESTATTTVTYPKILITEIQLASASSTKDEFAEIYNPNGETVDLTGWYMEKKTKSAADFSTFAKADLFDGRSIAPYGFLVIANPEGDVVPDISSTYGLAANNTLVIKNPNREIVDKVGWGEAGDYESGPAANPPNDQSVGRKITAGLFMDTDDNRADFEISSCPSPGKINELCDISESTSTEADSATSTISASSTLVASAGYDSSARIISLSWDWGDASSSLANDISFAVKLASEEASSSENIVWADEALEATTTQKSLDLPIMEVGRSYHFLVEALDASSSEIASATTSVFASGFLDNLYFYANPKEPSVALADIYTSKEIGALTDLLVFYLNQEPPGVSEIISEGNLSNVSQLGSLSIKYQPCGSPNPINEAYFSTAPIIIFGRGDCYAGPTSSDLSPDQLEDPNHLKLFTADSPADLNLSTSSYLTSSYYGITPGGPWGTRTFHLLAADDTKYYFRDYSLGDISGFNQPPTEPAGFSTDSYQDGLSAYLLFDWTRSTDSDSLDGLITYKLKLSSAASSTSLLDGAPLGILKTGDALNPQKDVVSGESYEVFLNHNNTDPINNFPKFYPASSGEYLASLVACDEFDNCSKAATTTFKSVVSSIIASASEGSNPVPLRANNYWGRIAQKFSVSQDIHPTNLTIVLSTCAPISCSGMNPIGAKISLKSSLAGDSLYAETIPAESVFRMELSDSDRAAGRISLSLPEDLILTAGDYYLLIEPDPPAGQALWEMRSYEDSGYDAGSLYAFDGTNWQALPDKDLYFELRGI
ncbi:MAG TPA: lamin tail domain-containing protein [Candidatus Tyrphobacter sp.]|nr:lamin tail domain-containing protein [Candidatus Tyrphobacter sp.]